MYRPIVIRGKEWQGRELLRRSGKVGALRKLLKIETARFERSHEMGADTGRANDPIGDQQPLNGSGR